MTKDDKVSIAKAILGDEKFVFRKCKNERDVKSEIRRFLRQFDHIWMFMPVQSGFGVSGTPDFVGCCRGMTFGIEAKFGDNKSTPMQKIQQDAMTKAGACVWEVNETTLETFAAEWNRLFPEIVWS